jgi:hypothetical protein
MVLLTSSPDFANAIRINHIFPRWYQFDRYGNMLYNDVMVLSVMRHNAMLCNTYARLHGKNPHLSSLEVS